MQLDKKARGGRLRFVLLRGIGEAYVTDDTVKTRLDRVLAGHE
jgi:3-dehydroquinate synthetase